MSPVKKISAKFSTSPENLYRRAEEMLSRQPQDYAATKNMHELIHDLHVHQMELTLQNEDLTRTQDELLESRNLYCDLYDFAPIGYLTIGQDGTISQANLMAATLFGIERSALIGKKITSLVFAEDQDIYYFYNHNLLTNRERQHCEIRLLKNNGSLFYARLDSISYWRNDNALLYRMAVIDITEKKRLEEALHSALHDAEAANEAKSEFLANMSHEIRTPLNAIVGIINLFRMQDCSPEKQALYIQTLDDSAKALLQLVNNTLDFAKIESRMLNLETKPFNLHGVIQESINIVTVKAAERGLHLAIDYPDNMHKIFWGDVLRIRQILLNLLNNAIKFTEAGNVTVKVETDRLAVHINVIDTGIGIPLDKQECIFNKFTQEDTSTTRKYGGTGLGLSICRQLAQLMHGNIEVRSQPGKGSTFILHLPLETASTVENEKNAVAQPILQPAKGVHSGIKILLVEDYGANILVATHLLDYFGYEYEVAKSSDEALSKLEEGNFSLALMDIQMEGRDGLETTRLIRKMEAKQGKARIPIIAMTAHALTGDKEKCLEAGMDAYITKPVDAETLQNTLAQFAEHKVKTIEHT